MQYLNTTIKRQIHPSFNTLLERSQSHVLAIGYRIVMYKSKFKKRLFILRRILTLFNI